MRGISEAQKPIQMKTEKQDERVHAVIGGDPNTKSSSSSKKEVASCVDKPKSLRGLEVVVVGVGK